MHRKVEDDKIILSRERETVTIHKENKTVDFSEVQYTFDEVLNIAHEIAETFNEHEEPSNPDDGSWEGR